MIVGGSLDSFPYSIRTNEYHTESKQYKESKERERKATPVTIVMVDDKTVKTIGNNFSYYEFSMKEIHKKIEG